MEFFMPFTGAAMRLAVTGLLHARYYQVTADDHPRLVGEEGPQGSSLETVLIPEVYPRRSKMAAVARALDRTLAIQVDTGTLKTLVIFCGSGLTASLLLAFHGLDLSQGFF
jgi:hypothetical protein